MMVNKSNNHLSPKPINDKKATTCDVGNPYPVLRHAHKYGTVETE